MNYNDIISLIVNDFNRSFNLSSEIIYDSRENIINKNPHFKIGKSAAGLLDKIILILIFQRNFLHMNYLSNCLFLTCFVLFLFL